MDQIPGTILSIAAAGGYITQLVVNAFTVGNPDRPSWLPPILAMIVGIAACAVVALSQIAATVPIDRTLIATIIGAGLLAGGGAIGGHALGSAARDKREEVREPGPRRY